MIRALCVALGLAGCSGPDGEALPVPPIPPPAQAKAAAAHPDFCQLSERIVIAAPDVLSDRTAAVISRLNARFTQHCDPNKPWILK